MIAIKNSVASGIGYTYMFVSFICLPLCMREGRKKKRCVNMYICVNMC